MKFPTFLGLCALLSSLAIEGVAQPSTQPGPAAEAPRATPQEQLEIEALQGEGEIDLSTGIITYRNGVIVKYGQAVLTADTVSGDRNTGQVLATGNVILVGEGGHIWRGEQLEYNFYTRIMGGNNFRTGQPPYFATGERVVTDPTNGAYLATNAFFTTDDNPKPNYRIRAKKLIIIPGKSIEARNATLYAGSVPVFYFPYYHKSLERHPNNFEFTPGYRSSWGPFLLSSYNWYWSQRLNGAVNLDLRGQRGIAAGPDFWFGSPTLGEAMLRYYYAHDEDPRSRPGFGEMPDNRQRVLFTYQGVLRTNLSVRGVVAYQGDLLIVRDFFESEYHDNVQPKSFVEANQQWSNWSLDLLGQVQVNDFQETIERLPDLRLTGLRQQVGPSPLYYESESSIGYFRHAFPDINTNFFYPFESNSYSATRADTFHQVLLPKTFFGFLNVTPRVGNRVTYYSETEGRGTVLDEQTRNVFNTGAEVGMKASRVFRDAESDLLDVHTLRHIIEPSINYVYVPGVETRPHEIPQFDRQMPTSRLLPIDFPDYNSIDSIDSQQTMRFGIRNKFQTKRDEGIDNLLNWAVYTDWRMSPHTGQKTFSDIYSDLDFRPRDWITLNSETRYSMSGGKFNEANHLLTLQPGETWAVQLGHLFREESPELGIGNNLIRATIFYRFTENWGARVSHYFEARDGTLEYQYYSVYRDFRSWTGALTLRLREDHNGHKDTAVAFTISLKAMPRFGVGSDAVRPQRLIGG